MRVFPTWAYKKSSVPLAYLLLLLPGSHLVGKYSQSTLKVVRKYQLLEREKQYQKNANYLPTILVV